MTGLLSYIADHISAEDPKYGQILLAHLGKMDAAFTERAESFFARYKTHIESTGKTLDFGLDCFKALRANVQEERIAFLRTGNYANTSFEDVNRRVYNNPDIMVMYMHGLVFAQFLWPEQYRRFSFFCEHLGEYREGVRSYLEIGGGHGLYVHQALQTLRPDAVFDLVDISTSSLELARGVVGDSRVRYHLKDIFEFTGEEHYDFVTVGEVLEHVERPDELLGRIHALLSPNGRAYITTPANAPMMDHIYLFHDADEIRAMLQSCGFVIEQEVTQFAADLPLKRNISLKTALMFGAFVRKA